MNLYFNNNSDLVGWTISLGSIIVFEILSVLEVGVPLRFCHEKTPQRMEGGGSI